ncbi:MAG: hypothetical protein OXC99_12135 [Chloroflexi bacterium]|nr:hypothetical protein [Chloroflexota bacterium]
MLDDLVGTIRALQKRLKEHQNYFRSGGEQEMRARVALIDPMLLALGWDPADPGVVEVEPKVKQVGWADYALMSKGNVVMFVEAKKLSEDVDKHVQQTINYMGHENIGRSPKVQYCAVTNGDTWKVYGTSEQDFVMDVSILSESPEKAALKLLGLWQPNYEIGGFDVGREPFLVEYGSAGTVHDPAPAPAPVADPLSVVSPLPPGWTPLSQAPEPTNKPAPKAIHLPDGERTLTAWRGVLVQIALWLYRKEVLTPKNCEGVRRGKKVVFSTSGMHPDGSPFKSAVPLEDTGIILEAHLSASEIVRLALRALKHFDQDPSQVSLKLS